MDNFLFCNLLFVSLLLYEIRTFKLKSSSCSFVGLPKFVVLLPLVFTNNSSFTMLQKFHVQFDAGTQNRVFLSWDFSNYNVVYIVTSPSA